MTRRRSRRRPSFNLVVGDINVDILARVEAAACLGDDNLTRRFEMHLGGVGSNTALSLARWGARIRLLGAVGQDWFGDFALARLRRESVDVALVQRSRRSLTGVMFVAVSPNGERTFLGSRGANEELVLPESRLAHLQALHLVGYTFLAGTAARTGRRLLLEARRRGTPTSLDVGMGPSRRVREQILQAARRVDILLASRDEARALTGERESRSALLALERQGAGEVVIKAGTAGCWLRVGGQPLRVPSLPASATDTTGCGDAFTAAYLQARWAGWPSEEAALLANAAGAAAARVMGAGEELPRPGEIIRTLTQARLEPAWQAVRRRVLARWKHTRPRKRSEGD